MATEQPRKEHRAVLKVLAFTDENGAHPAVSYDNLLGTTWSDNADESYASGSVQIVADSWEPLPINQMAILEIDESDTDGGKGASWKALAMIAGDQAVAMDKDSEGTGIAKAKRFLHQVQLIEGTALLDKFIASLYSFPKVGAKRWNVSTAVERILGTCPEYSPQDKDANAGRFFSGIDDLTPLPEIIVPRGTLRTAINAVLATVDKKAELVYDETANKYTVNAVSLNPPEPQAIANLSGMVTFKATADAQSGGNAIQAEIAKGIPDQPIDNARVARTPRSQSNYFADDDLYFEADFPIDSISHFYVFPIVNPQGGDIEWPYYYNKNFGYTGKTVGGIGFVLPGLNSYFQKVDLAGRVVTSDRYTALDVGETTTQGQSQKSSFYYEKGNTQFPYVLTETNDPIFTQDRMKDITASVISEKRKSTDYAKIAFDWMDQCRTAVQLQPLSLIDAPTQQAYLSYLESSKGTEGIDSMANVLKGTGENGGTPSDIGSGDITMATGGDLLYRLTYTPQVDAELVQQKSDFPPIWRRSSNIAQGTSPTDLERSGNAMANYLKKTGNPTVTVGRIFGSLDDGNQLLVKGDDGVAQGMSAYVLTNRTMVFHRNHLEESLTFQKGYNRVRNYTGLDRAFRDTPRASSTKQRQINYYLYKGSNMTVQRHLEAGMKFRATLEMLDQSQNKVGDLGERDCACYDFGDTLAFTIRMPDSNVIGVQAPTDGTRSQKPVLLTRQTPFPYENYIRFKIYSTRNRVDYGIPTELPMPWRASDSLAGTGPEGWTGIAPDLSKPVLAKVDLPVAKSYDMYSGKDKKTLEERYWCAFPKGVYLLAKNGSPLNANDGRRLGLGSDPHDVDPDTGQDYEFQAHMGYFNYVWVRWCDLDDIDDAAAISDLLPQAPANPNDDGATAIQNALNETTVKFGKQYPLTFPEYFTNSPDYQGNGDFLELAGTLKVNLTEDEVMTLTIQIPKSVIPKT